MSFDSLNSTESRSGNEHPLLRLGRDDLDLIVQLVLCSGSLKGLAEVYGVSYPTIRARLDKTIERLRAAVEGRRPDPLNELLADLLDRGELSPSAARTIREVARREVERGAAGSSRDEQQPSGVQGDQR